MPNDMLPHILMYFRAEKTAGFYLLLIAVVAIAVSAWLWWSKSRIRGMALPLALIAIIELGVGGTVYLRTDRQIDSLTEQYYSNPVAYKSTEIARMGMVMTSFQIYKMVEMALLILGIALVVVFRARPFIFSIGVGLIVQMGILLAFDWLAAQRAALYMDAIGRMK